MTNITMTADLFLTILGVALSVAGTMSTGGFFVIRAIIAKDIKPLSDTAIELKSAVLGLTKELERNEKQSEQSAANLTKEVARVADELGRVRERVVAVEAVNGVEHKRRSTDHP